MSRIFDARPCALGEGPLWHPVRGQLFWFDITANRLLSQTTAGPQEWRFDENVSAAGWISRAEMIIASETALLRFNVETGQSDVLCPLEADSPDTRSNDGRADPQGGFWIGTMSKTQVPKAGAIYRFHRGELRRLFPEITIPNAICFAPDGKSAYFADTRDGRVMRVALDAAGWPVGTPQTFVDLRAEALNPDGAVVDAQGVLWLAQWGAARVAAYAPDGQFLRAVEFAAPHTSCPAFGGADLNTLFCTTALQGMSDAARAKHPDAGKTFAADGVARGQAEHRVIL
ncbi:MAG: SMP-30/gluconolactonase/LRE family protein [Paracoccaceae bacterium]|nr:SMP-30/gluconolactonase/LRE family protein [Paracoccaceae bacterium]